MEILRLLTAGSVDDGKSTLIGRMFFDSGKIAEDHLDAMNLASQKQGKSDLNLALFTDGLKAERERGITIDVAYRYFENETRKFILADSPGHLEFTRNMVTAASKADVALILIDIERGVTEQTRRHSWLCQWLGIQNIAFCVNKMDQVQYEEKVFIEVKNNMESWFKNIQTSPQLHFFPLSALLGEGVVHASAKLSWYQGPTLMEWLNSVQIHPSHASVPVRFTVQMQMESNTKLKGFTGRVMSGQIGVGDQLSCLRTGEAIRIQRIEKFGSEKESTHADELPTLYNDEREAVVRGDLLVTVNSLPQSSARWEVELCFLGMDKRALHARFWARTDYFETGAVVESVEQELNLDRLEWDQFKSSEFRSNQILRAIIQFDDLVHADPFGTLPESGRMILIDESNLDTVAAVLLKKPL